MFGAYFALGQSVKNKFVLTQAPTGHQGVGISLGSPCYYTVLSPQRAYTRNSEDHAIIPYTQEFDLVATDR